MKRLALATASAVVLGLTACSHANHPSASHAGHVSSAPIVPVSCSQQYRTWNDGKGKGVMGALNAVASATTARHAHLLTVALNQARPAVSRAAQHPIPACADPRGYWTVLLMHVNAATTGKASMSGARAALHDVPKIHQQLIAEVKEIAQ